MLVKREDVLFFLSLFLPFKVSVLSLQLEGRQAWRCYFWTSEESVMSVWVEG